MDGLIGLAIDAHTHTYTHTHTYIYMDGWIILQAVQ